MIAQAYRQYEMTQAQTADGGELVIMLYQGAIRFLGRASDALEAGKGQEAHNNLVRTQEILVELMCSLDMDTGNVAVNLFKLYEYMHHRLVQANVEKDRKPVEEVTGFLRQLLSAWQVAVRSVKAGNAEGTASGGSYGLSRW